MKTTLLILGMALGSVSNFAQDTTRNGGTVLPGSGGRYGNLTEETEHFTQTVDYGREDGSIRMDGEYTKPRWKKESSKNTNFIVALVLITLGILSLVVGIFQKKKEQP